MRPLARRLDEKKVKWASHVDDDVREWRKTWRSRNMLTERADSSGGYSMAWWQKLGKTFGLWLSPCVVWS